MSTRDWTHVVNRYGGTPEQWEAAFEAVHSCRNGEMVPLPAGVNPRDFIAVMNTYAPEEK